MASKARLPYLLLALSIVAYVALGYGIERVSAKYFEQSYEFPLFLGLFGLLFGIYFYLVINKTINLNWQSILLWAFLLRFSLLFMMPNLSDDYYRFAWDGQLTTQGVNPFLDTPENLIAEGQFDNMEHMTELYDGMNSPIFYSVYPPINQAMFAVAVLIGGDNIYAVILIMRLLILLAELGTVFFLLRLLQHFGKPDKLAMIYAFNPLVIMELTGNLHFEGVMLFFLVAALYYLAKERWHWSAVSIAIAIGVKLVPLMLLPLLIRRIGWAKSILYFCITGAVLALMFIPFLSTELVAHFGESIDLYFQYFEFNASIFYVIKEIHLATVGWDPIRFMGPILSGFVLLIILLFAFRHKHNWDQLWRKMLLALLVYYSLAIIVHPWYISTLVLVGALTQFRFAMVWSALALLSYAAYLTDAYYENLYIVMVEYVIVFAVFFYEIRKGGRSLFFIE
jgi:alpha-1,6-mannosyltransferase